MAGRPDRERTQGIHVKAQIVAIVLASLLLALVVGYAVLSWLESTA